MSVKFEENIKFKKTLKEVKELIKNAIFEIDGGEHAEIFLKTAENKIIEALES